MSFKNKNKKSFSKKVEKGISPKLLKTLQKLINHQAGSVSYVFISEKTQKVFNPETDSYIDEPIKSMLHTSITSYTLQGDKPGTLKTPTELMDMFHTIKHDIGASYFIVD